MKIISSAHALVSVVKNHILLSAMMTLIYVTTLALIVGYYCCSPKILYFRRILAFRALKLSRDEEKEGTKTRIHMYLNGTQREY